ncbi:SDR family NAD(P)-dependent oxidoreductase [Variovorax sp. NFACC28]|uniref:SDR family NAD(P)-dependent oxidoreductase n=1 Tax=Variovorax sp. NFACC28 TaxID=1566273 RepID=UPI003AAB8633
MTILKSARQQGSLDSVAVQAAAPAHAKGEVETLLLRPTWQEAQLPAAEPVSYGAHWVVLCEVGGDAGAALKAALPQARCLHLSAEGADLSTRYGGYAAQLLAYLQAMFSEKPSGWVRVQLVVPASGEGALLAGLGGMLKSARQESPKLVIQVLGVEPSLGGEALAQCVSAEAQAFEEDVRYRAATREVMRLEEVREDAEQAQALVPTPWKRGGVYLISGGAGGLGLIFGKAIATAVSDVTLVLTGRSVLGAEKLEQLRQLEALGARVVYRQMDVADSAAVEACVAEMVQTHGPLTGVIHTARVLHDGGLMKKTESELRAVLAPKVAGVLALDAATRDQPLEVFVSLAFAADNAGQLDRATADAFLNAYAAHRAMAVQAGERSGRTRSIDGPSWENGTLERALSLDSPRVTVLSGVRAPIEPTVPTASHSVRRSESTADLGVDLQALQEKVLRRFLALFSKVAKIDADRIDPEEALERYGIDSVMVSQLNLALNEIFGEEISKTLFFEYRTLSALAGYLVGAYPQTCAQWSGVGKAPAVASLGDVTASSGGRGPVVVRQVRSASRATWGSRQADREPIAIVGLGGRYPKAATLEAFWENLKQGVNCIGEIPSERWSLEGFYHPDPDQAAAQGKSYGKWGGFLEGFAEFDPLFFGISPREAETMDPQERLFVQACWEALEDAGYTRARLAALHKGRVGVYAGITKIGHELYGPELRRQGTQALPQTSFSSVANRVSYLFDFHGPSMPLDTMCSASFTAIHEACEHLLRGECEVALAGGVNLNLHPSNYLTMSAVRMLSTEGLCRSFGAGGDGYVPGEGVGVLFLKRLSLAEADGDQIYGLIKATAINHGGKTNGYTVPNPQAQGELIEDALRKAGVHPRTISYVEAHGTGTALGDPIEVAGLSKAFGAQTQDRQYCAIGSAKSNIGHCESAAGIAGLTKVLLQLKHGQLVPSLHSEELNPNIDFARTPFVVQRTLGEWKRPQVSLAGEPQREYPRIAGISSFGAGGSNAHVIVQEYRAAEPARARVAVTPQRPAVVVLSARREERLREAVHRLLSHVERQGCTDEERGLAFDWARLYDGEVTPRRISLPTYPFAKERYWMATREETSRPDQPRRAVDEAPSRVSSASVEVAEAAEILTFEEVWDAQALSSGRESQSGTLVCFLSAPAHQQAVAKVVSEQAPGTTLVFVTQGHVTAPADGLVRHAWSGTAMDGGEILEAIAATHGPLDALAYLWPLEASALLEDAVPILHLLQALGRRRIDCARLVLAGQSCCDAELAHLSSWIGLGRSMKLVLPSIPLSVVGQQAAAGETVDFAAWARRLLLELAAPRGQSALYRGETRYVPKTRDLACTPQALPLRRDGAYWITGGLGGLGFVFAQYLARQHGARLVLSGRSMLDASRQAQLASLERLGAQVLYVQADVTDRDAMRDGLAQALARFGAIDGVLHAAGLDSEVDLLEKDPEQFRAILAPKVTGTLVLEDLLCEQPLEFVCYFASASAVLGDFGAGDYAMGNRFLMAYAQARDERRARGEVVGRTLAIAWPLWQDGQMSGRDRARIDLYLKSSGQQALTSAEGVALFERLLGQPSPAPLVMKGQPARVRGLLGLGDETECSAPDAEAGSSVAPAGRGRRPEMKGFDVETCVVWDLREKVSTLLDVPRAQLGLEENLADFGFDSIRLAELSRCLNGHFGIDLTPAVFFSHPSLGRLAAYLMDKYAMPLAEFYQEGTETPGAVGDRTVERGTATTGEVARHEPDPTSLLADEPIAIIGMSGRFPGARTVEELWEILRQGRTVVEEIPPDRFDWRPYAGDPMKDPGKTNGRWLGALPGVAEFDPQFFEISPKEAELMDPRQRLLLQEAWAALEDAGYGRAHLDRQSVGMFVGVEQGDYQYLVGEQGSVTGNHDGILAARLAYVLNLQGPALAINTACSSGLVALHEACLSLRMGECETAIAAGANLVLTPQMFVALGRAGMLSPDGKSYAFDRRANGMVPGEAVVAVVLKRLSHAERDGDPIQGVIRGSGINYDGKTNGITAPSGMAQTRLLRDVHRRFGIDPARIDYVVAHGTGTRLGDPIEVNALYEAFAGCEGVRPGQCALTSTKTNFGHTFAASGLLSLVALVQAMRHCEIPASLDCEQLSDYIPWEASPFYVNGARKPWPSQGRPRLGAVSAFGMSGTNAHVVVESYEEKAATPTSSVPRFHLLVVSAKTEEALAARVQALAGALGAKAWSSVDLCALSCTLLTGRHHFAHRCALVVQDRDDALHAMSRIGGREKLPGLFQGQVGRNFAAQKALARYGFELLARTAQPGLSHVDRQENLQALADLYCQGYELPWERLFGDRPPRRISLPTYPFARERYWVPQMQKPQAQASSVPGAVFAKNPVSEQLHPLMHRNTSSLAEQRFSSVFTGEEFFLADHVVKGQRVLPGVAYLELARAAVVQALELAASQARDVRLEQVVFAQPVVVGDAPVEVHIALVPQDVGLVSFEVYTQVVGEEEARVHAQGRARVAAAADAPLEDLGRLRSQCSQVFASEACYAEFARMGLAYGPAFQSLMEVRVGQDAAGRPMALGDVQMPSQGTDPAAFVLPPSLLDGALQASIGLVFAQPQDRLSLPFAVEAVELYGAVPEKAVAVVRQSAGSTIGDAVLKLDVSLVDAEGRVCVQLRGFSSRVLGQAAPTKPASPPVAPAMAAMPVGQLTLVADWVVCTPSTGMRWPSQEERVLVVGGSDAQQQACLSRYAQAQCLRPAEPWSIEEMAAQLKERAPFSHVLWFVPSGAEVGLISQEMIGAQQQGVLACFRLVKALFSAGHGSKALGLTIVTQQAVAVDESDEVLPAHAAVHGLVGSLAKEHPNWRVRLVDVPAGQEWSLDEVLALPADAQGNALACRHGEWYRQELVSSTLPAPARQGYRRGGVYVLLGGAGGIGEVFSEYLIREYQAQVIWIGRRPEDEAIEAKRARLGTLGPAPYYLSADATNHVLLQAAYEAIKERFGVIHGVVHSVLVLQDQSLMRMEEKTFVGSLEAKVDVSVRLAEVFGREALDFVLFLSSSQSLHRAVGQSNYAAGCTFVDAYAQALSRAWPCAVKVVNWGYWGSVGVVASADYRARMAKVGLDSIEPPEAMDVLERLLASPVSRVIYIKTTTPEFAQAMGVAAGEARQVVPGVSSVAEVLPRATAVESPVDMSAETKQTLDNLLAGLLWGQLCELGLASQPVVDVEAWKARVGLPSLYGPWLVESLEVLEKRGYLAREGGVLRVLMADAPDRDALWSRWEACKLQLGPEYQAQINFVDAALRALPEILRGRRAATEVLFPNGSMELVEGIYRDNEVSDYFNEVLAESLVAAVKARLAQDPQAKLRLFEIGAGTGGTSALLFDRLAAYAAHIEEYCYTDLSKAFLLHAEKQYRAKAPYLKTQIFDVERSLAEQGVEVGRYDVVIATNVLHATREMRRTVGNTKALLKANGVVLINEMSSNSLFLQLTFGLLEGWWLSEDVPLRIPGSPALTPQAWRRLLEAQGFVDVRHPAEVAHGLGQQIVVGLSDGIVRQTVAAAPQVPRLPVSNAAPKPVRASPVDPVITGKDLQKRLQSSLVRAVSDLLKLESEDIDPEAELSEFGFDSITLTAFANVINGMYGLELTPTVLFEYPTLAGLSEHLLHEYRTVLAKQLGDTVRATAPELSDASVSAALPMGRSQRVRFAQAPAMPPERHAAAPAAAAVPVKPEPIAIIGVSGAFPQAEDLEDFWANLASGRDCIGEIPGSRWDWSRLYGDPAKEVNKTNIRHAGVIDGIAEFDPLFFGISPREAAAMDPQQRLLMTYVWRVIEDAGYAPAQLSGTDTGIFVGTAGSGYSGLLAQAGEPIEGYSSTGALSSIGPNRVSFLLNLHGPSEPIETACSSSLVAVHRAVQAMRTGQCGQAIVGGVNTLVSPEAHVSFTKAGMLSPDGRCKTFSKEANGYVRGEGVGMLMLKPLSKAQADGDHIYGLILGSAENHGGRANSLTAPNPKAQAALIRSAFEQAQVDPRSVSYIEAHGTGTPLGDPIEIQGLKSAFQAAAQGEALPTGYCGLGSVKTNIGHLELAAGVAGIVKVLLQFKHRTLVPSLHAKEINPYIDLSGSPFYVVQESREWVALRDDAGRELPRRAGVSSFGVGGVNAHVVLQEYRSAEPARAKVVVTPQRPVVVVLSAKQEVRLREAVQRLLAHVERQGCTDEDLADIAYTLQVGREAMEVRLACVVSTLEELKAKLAQYLAEAKGIDGLYRGTARRDKDGLATDEERQAMIEECATSGRSHRLVELWTKGMEVDWRQLCREAAPRRISLPSYPFARERYWVPPVRQVPSLQATDVGKPLHPLLHRNTSKPAERQLPEGLYK